MEAIVIHPLFAVLTGWIAYNLLMFSIEKDKADAQDIDFNLKNYALKRWDNWVVSLAFIPVLLFIGYKGLSLNPFDSHPVQWTDLYYLFSGFAPELAKHFLNKWNNRA